MADGEGLSGVGGEAAEQHRASEIDDPGEQTHPMQDAEGVSDDRARHMSGRGYGKGCRSFHKRKKDDSSDPDDKGKKHEEAKNSHGKAVLRCRCTVLDWRPSRN